MMSTSPILALADVTSAPAPSASAARARLIAAHLPSIEALAVCGALASAAFASPAIAAALGAASTYCFRTRRAGTPADLRLRQSHARRACAAIALSLALGTAGNLHVNGSSARNFLCNQWLSHQARELWQSTLSPQVVARRYIAPYFSRN